MTGGAGPGDCGCLLVDSRGTLCPQPVIDLARSAKGRPGGTEIVLLADDPAAALDVPAWCRLRGHAYLGGRPEGSGTAYRVRLADTAGGRAP